jgi:hypothetical protein
MSVSSHLNPEPERRLWIIHEHLRGDIEWTDVKLLALAAICAALLPAVRYAVPAGGPAASAMALLAAALPLALAGASPLVEGRRQFLLLDRRLDKLHPGDSLISASDIAKCPQMELVIMLDKYLGGGITATQYYEDIVAQIVLAARVATRKRRLLAASGAIAGAAQLCLLWRFLAR